MNLRGRQWSPVVVCADCVLIVHVAVYEIVYVSERAIGVRRLYAPIICTDHM